MFNLENHKQLMQLCWKMMTAPENRTRASLVLLLDLVNSAARLGGPYLMATSMGKLEEGAEDALPGIIAMTLLMAVNQIIPSIRASLADPLKFPLPRELATRVIDTYLHAPEDKTPLGEVAQLVYGPYSTTPEVLPTLLEDFSTITEMIAAAAYIGYAFNPVFAVALIAVAVISLGISVASSKKVSTAFEKQIEAGRVAGGKLESALEKRKVGWIFNRDELGRATGAIREYEAGFIPARTIQERVILSQKMLVSVSFVASLLWAASQVIKGNYPPSLFLGLLFYLNQFVAPLTNLTQSVKPINTAAKQVGAIEEYLKAHPKRVDAPGSTPLVLTEGAPVSISFEGVGFAYPEKAHTFRDLTCTIRPGITVIVGENGSGKSTLTKFILGMIDPSTGTIAMNGRDITTCTSASLRDQIALIPQGGEIVRGTIREMLSYGLLDGTEVTDEELYSPLRRVGLEAWVRSLDKGLETEVGGLAEGASGGQFQKMSLVRGLLRIEKVKASIVILDEPETGLDEASKEIVKTILREMKTAGKTIIVISHSSGEGSIRSMADQVLDLSALQASPRAFAAVAGIDASSASAAGVGAVAVTVAADSELAGPP